MPTLATTTGNVLAGIAFDPTIRGILSVLVGVVVLMGSVYLLLGTNTGARLGFLLAMTGFFGWMAIMGALWWIYGIGMQGQAPEWDVVEYNEGDPAQAVTDDVRDLDFSVLPSDADGIDHETLQDLPDEDPEQFEALADQFEEASDGWELLAPSDAVRNEAEATVSSAVAECTTCSFDFSGASDYVALAAYETGGKEGLPENPNVWDRIVTKVEQTLQLTHPDHYAVLQIQAAREQEAVAGQPPPVPEPDPSEPVINVVMIRDIGDVRFPAAMITIGSTAIFLLLCWVLHQRERLLEENLEHAEDVQAGAS
ncbi:MAG: hypothetical protein U5K30_05200 [Acidimicrobiales bacterium]|nr:hypothetical protein [Acidimicrobiales bacterium]